MWCVTCFATDHLHGQQATLLLVCAQAVKQLCDLMQHNAGCPHFAAADVTAERYCLCCRTGSSSGGDVCGCYSVGTEAVNSQTQSKSAIHYQQWLVKQYQHFSFTCAPGHY